MPRRGAARWPRGSVAVAETVSRHKADGRESREREREGEGERVDGSASKNNSQAEARLAICNFTND